MRTLIILFAAMMTACAHQQTASNTRNQSVNRKNAQAVTKKQSRIELLKAQRESKEFAREKKLIVGKKTFAAAVPATVRPQNKKVVVALNSPLTPAVKEVDLMNELRTRYDRGDEIGFRSRYQAFERSFARSKNAPEVHYMAGVLALSYKDYGPALKAFDKSFQMGPKSAFASRALFAKGVTYRRLNLKEPAQKVLASVKTQFPQSLEASRADVELKILAGMAR